MTTEKLELPTVDVDSNYVKVEDLRYGENPHQEATLYRDTQYDGPNIPDAEQLSGKPLSYNNLLDLDAALALVCEFPLRPTAVIIKHNNPCGVASADRQITEAFKKALETDPMSAYGGILAVNRKVTVPLANEITGGKTFFEAIVAPRYDPKAVEILTTRRKWGKNLRILTLNSDRVFQPIGHSGRQVRTIAGGVLVQTIDVTLFAGEPECVTEKQPTEDQHDQLDFAWTVAMHVRSNAIVLAREDFTSGIGAGQMNRLDSVALAITRARGWSKGSVLASDGFFPFKDGPEVAISAGITAIIQPGGSIRDEEVIDLCNALGIPMLFTNIRHFKH